MVSTGTCMISGLPNQGSNERLAIVIQGNVLTGLHNCTTFSFATVGE